MTGRDAVRDQLAAALGDDVLVPVERGPVLDALLPVVDLIANQRAAAELEKAQEVAYRSHTTAEVYSCLYVRAAALRASNGKGATPC